MARSYWLYVSKVFNTGWLVLYIKYLKREVIKEAETLAERWMWLGLVWNQRQLGNVRDLHKRCAKITGYLWDLLSMNSKYLSLQGKNIGLVCFRKWYYLSLFKRGLGKCTNLASAQSATGRKNAKNIVLRIKYYQVIRNQQHFLVCIAVLNWVLIRNIFVWNKWFREGWQGHEKTFL